MAIKIAGVDVINDDRELVLAKLTDINETINDTAVDVFVYDTSKDSDGGAWRHRTQHTSWYAEASSASRDEDTRSTRAEFPAVAVIVAESNKVTIYDGDDPSLPMWMVFNRASDSYFASGSAACSSVVMSNGLLVFGCVGTREISFLTDSALFRATSGANDCSEPISGRNSGNTFSGYYGTGIVNNNVNDVAMTVLPDAPTDPATGLPVPTIAVATDGGVSVIKDDGTVVDITHTVQTKVGNVVFREADGALGYSIGAAIYNNGRIHYDHDLPMADVAKGAYFSGANSDEYYTAWDGDTSVSGRILPQTVGTSDFNSLADGSVAGPGGINRIDPDPTTPANGMVAYTTSSYATGWMPGDIKMAALADTTAETLSGSELVTNGDFPTGLSDGDVGYDNGDGTVDGWTALNSSLSVASNRLRVTNTAAAQGQGRLAFSTVAGQVYTLSADVTLGTSNKAMLFIYNDPGTTNLASNTNIGSTGTYSLTFTALSTSTAVSLYNYSAVSGEYSDFENISVRLADPDRSVNGKGLGVHGTITKAPVATGADVVGYSGFDSSNYLEQPYNSDLDFGAYTGTAGTGDFSVMGWVKMSSPVVNEVFFEKGVDSTSRTIAAGYEQSTDRLYALISGSIIYSQSSFASSAWKFIVVSRASGTASIYINGGLVASASATGTVSNSSDVVRVGRGLRFPADVAASSSLALIRISATAPTADQIAKIYEDEKVLFQPNAKATLTGSSDAVTALAHDPDTELLHVGTSGGRSVFQGLRRVEEHTGTNSQSLAAISAVDGLIVEGK